MAVLLLAGNVTFAQSTSGDLVGTIKDPTGAAIPKASVVVTSESTGVKTTVESGANGDYRVANLLPAAYDIEVNVAGFQASRLKGVIVNLTRRLLRT